MIFFVVVGLGSKLIAVDEGGCKRSDPWDDISSTPPAGC